MTKSFSRYSGATTATPCRSMSEKLLFELPEIRITTEHIVFRDVTFAINYIASTDISEQWTRRSDCILLIVMAVMATIWSYLDSLLHGVWNFIALCLLCGLIGKIAAILPKKYVLKIKMTDKMFYEVVTRTEQEAEIIQGYINEAKAHGK